MISREKESGMNVMKREGVVYGMPEAEYHAPKDELSSTGAKLLLKSPEKFKYEVLDGNRVHRDAYDIGTAVHTKVLGVGAAAVSCPPELLDSTGGMRTKASKEWKEAQQAAGVPVVSAADLVVIDRMAENVLAHPLARTLFERPGHSEVSVFDEYLGVKRRCRFDRLPDEGGVAVDLKTTIDGSWQGFANAAANFGYHIQRAHYLDILRRSTGRELDMRFVVVEKSAPYSVAVHPLDEQFAEIGEAEALEAVDVFRRCMDEGVWPGYPMDLRPVKPPMRVIYDYQDKYENEGILVNEH